MRYFLALALVVNSIELEDNITFGNNSDVEVPKDIEDARSPGIVEALEIDPLAEKTSSNQTISSSARPALSKAVLAILCYLGDAAVQTEARDCQDVVVPHGYEEICGRWQCSDARVDGCYFTDMDSVLPRGTQPPAKDLTSLSDKNISKSVSSLQCPWDDPLATGLDSNVTWRQPVEGSRRTFIQHLQSTKAERQLSVARSREAVLRYTPHAEIYANLLSIIETVRSSASNRTAFLQSRNISRFRWRPISLHPCNEPSFGDLFGARKRPQCEIEQPICSLHDWESQRQELERKAWMDLFSEQKRAQDLDRAAAEANARAAAEVNETTLLWRRQNQCRLFEPFWQCDAHNGQRLSRIWQSFGEGLIDKLNGSADLEATPTVVIGIGSSPTNNTTSTGTKTQQWRHCANEGELCLCTGDVRFGAVGQWAPVVLTVRHGIVSCSAGLFLFEGASSSADGDTHVCECTSGRMDLDGPFISATMPTSEKLMRSNDSTPAENKTEERFIHGVPYTEEFRRGVRYDYASIGAGARMVTYAKGIRRAKSVLSPDYEYLQTVCKDRSWFVVSLLEDLLLEHIGLVTLEFFASGFRHLQILGSREYPTEQWRLLGEIETSPTVTHELFNVGSRCRDQVDGCWIKFLKVRVLSHHELEPNTYCALTRFQAFGSTQITHLDEEKKAQDDAGRQLDPTVVDIVDWHDKAAHGALSNLLGEDDDSVVQQYVSWDDHASHNKSSNGDEISNWDNVDAGGLAPAHVNAFQRIVDGLSRGAKSLLPKFFQRLHPQSDSVSDSVESDADADGGNEVPDEKAAEPASTTERAVASLSEVLNDFNVSGTLSDADLSIFERLRSTLASLNGSGADLVAATASLGAGVLPTTSAPAPPPPKPTTSSSKPALVRIADDVQIVQDKYTALDKKMKGVASGLSSVLVLVVEALRQHDVQVRSIADAQELRDVLLQNATFVHAPSNSSDFSGMSLRTFVLRGIVDSWSHQMFDRCLILMLIVWISYLHCSRESREKPRASSGDFTQSVHHQPLTMHRDANKIKLDTARLERDRNALHLARNAERPLPIDTGGETECLHTSPTWNPALDDNPSSEDGSDQAAPTSFQSLRSMIFGFEGEGSRSRGRAARQALSSEAGGSRHQRGPKRHSSAARRHAARGLKSSKEA